MSATTSTVSPELVEQVKKLKERCHYIFTEEEEAKGFKDAISGERCARPVHSKDFCLFHAGLLSRSAEKAESAKERFTQYVVDKPEEKFVESSYVSDRNGRKNNIKIDIRKRAIDLCNDELEGLRYPMREGAKWAWDAIAKVLAVVTNPKMDVGGKNKKQQKASKELMDMIKNSSNIEAIEQIKEDGDEQTN